MYVYIGVVFDLMMSPMQVLLSVVTQHSETQPRHFDRILLWKNNVLRSLGHFLYLFLLYSFASGNIFNLPQLVLKQLLDE